MKHSWILFLFPLSAWSQSLAPLSIEKIMRDPKWIGTSPSSIRWADDSKSIYFNWNPDKAISDSLYGISLSDHQPKKISPQERRAMDATNANYTASRSAKTFEKNGDIFYRDLISGKLLQVTATAVREQDPIWSADAVKIIFRSGNDLFSWNKNTGALTQLTNFKAGAKKAEAKLSEQDAWLKQDQLSNFMILKQRADKKAAADVQRKQNQPKTAKEFYLNGRDLEELQLSPDEQFITFRLATYPEEKIANVPDYVTESGYTTAIPTRSKVGSALPDYEFWVYDRRKDTIFQVSTKEIPGIHDLPDFVKDYPADSAKWNRWKKEERKVIFYGPYWNASGKQAVVVVRAQDNKDKWIFALDAASGKLKLLDRQRDEAWVGGPGVESYWSDAGSIGWLDEQTIWFPSEASGYAHLYTMNVNTGTKKQLTSGKFEVQNITLSRDKKSFYLITNEVHPGEQHFYKMPVSGGKMERISTMKGANEVTISPDEKYLAIRYSYSNKPWELYLMENKAGAKAERITQSISAEFQSYAWREPEVITVKAQDGADVYARLYKPAKPNGKAVIFVHGAGYLQNAHYWWSNYFREYMFHNLLADRGYTVMDMDYRGSAGYGRDWRTGIYRHMGGKDLSDQVDGAAYLVKNCGVDAGKIGIYGGSYGGFITLMAQFTQPGVFKSGAGIRSVTDWAHYNQGYTANILNDPANDSLAYRRSSPIYFADGLKGNLLILHGMLDLNVHFQDVVRLNQRLIELGKEHWEMALYPMEDHGFVEPSSWTDEYKRILNLFEETLD